MHYTPYGAGEKGAAQYDVEAYGERRGTGRRGCFDMRQCGMSLIYFWVEEGMPREPQRSATSSWEYDSSPEETREDE